jgi:hypothetical protein
MATILLRRRGAAARGGSPVFPSPLLATTPTPSPSPTFNADVVTPGPVGFIAIFLLTLVTVLLIIDMVRRIRRVRYRNEARERLVQETPPQD